MNTERPVTNVVPTELSRADGFFDLAFLFGMGLAAWWLALRGVPWWMFVPVLTPPSLEVLSGEPAGDIPFLGALAAGLRSKLGLRRAHEWVAAWLHYTRVRTWPDFLNWSSTTWQNSRLKSKMPTWNCSARLRTLSTALRLSRLRRLCIRCLPSSALARTRLTGQLPDADLGQ
jgi:hypothetical protein